MSILYTSFERIRTALAIGVVLVSFGFMTKAAMAAPDVFTVRGVKVDVTAENAVAAREKAFAEAQIVAFKALAQRLMDQSAAQDFTPPDVAVISPMLQDFEITDERLSAVEYIGTYTFRFDGPAVRRFFNMKGVSYSDVASRPVLILPFYQWGSRLVLWQENNPFLKAWSRNNPKGGLVPTVVPMGDIRDIGDIGDSQALTYNPAGLRSIVERYGAGEGIILIATPETASEPSQAGDAPAALSVMIYRTDRAMPEYVQTLKIIPDAGMNQDALYDKAVRETRAALQQEWKAQTTVNPALGNTTIRASAKYSTMQQWVETRNAIRRIQGIGAMKILSVTPREAQIELEFAGDVTRLNIALEQQGIMLLPPEVEYAYGGTPLYTLYLKKYARY